MLNIKILIILDVIMVSVMMVYKRNMLKSLITITLIHLEFALQQTRKY